MTRELVDRMRTCAAAIRASQETGNPWNTSGIVAADAMNLLEEAASALDAPEEPIGEPMGVIELPPKTSRPLSGVGQPVWGGSLLNATAAPCPACGDVSARTVHLLDGRKLQLTCPACAHQWEYGRG
jgi:hypothetical protein